MIAIQRRAAREPQLLQAEAPEEAFQSIVERRLARQLTADEEAYLAKLDKRFERVKQSGQIYDQDMVRLHPKWSIQSVEPLPLWPDAPTSLREFWDFIALALSERSLTIPTFLRGLVDLNEVRKPPQ